MGTNRVVPWWERRGKMPQSQRTAARPCGVVVQRHTVSMCTTNQNQIKADSKCQQVEAHVAGRLKERIDVVETHIHWVLISPLPFRKGALLDEFPIRRF